MQVLHEVGVGEWIAPRLRGWGVVGGVVPRGYEAYARVLHPGSISELIGHDREGGLIVEEHPARWREVAELRGAVLHPAAQWVALAGSSDQVPLGNDRYLNPPEQGRLDLDELAALARVLAGATATEVVLGVWRGWSELRPTRGSFAVFVPAGTSRRERKRIQAEMERQVAARGTSEAQRAAEIGPWLELPGREYVLLRCELNELTDPAWVASAGLGWYRDGPPSRALTPNLLWPLDRGWFVGTEIDFDSTLVGGSRAHIDAVLEAPDLEAFEVSDDTDLTTGADRINGPA